MNDSPQNRLEQFKNTLDITWKWSKNGFEPTTHTAKRPVNRASADLRGSVDIRQPTLVKMSPLLQSKFWDDDIS